MTRTWKNPQAGVYDNVFDDLDTTPVHPYHFSEPVDVSPDEPYASYAAAGDAPTSSLAYDGTCVSANRRLSGWQCA